MTWNSDLKITRLSRLYCGYSENTNTTLESQGVWEHFPYPSTGYSIWRSNDFSIDPIKTEFTYTGDKTIWLRLTATCNIYKGTGNSTNRNIEVQWRLNDTPAGPIRGSYMNNSDSIIISGSGQVRLSPGDRLSPFIRNIENSDPIRLDNCQFDIVQDPDEFWTPGV